MRNKFDALKANYKTNDDLRNELICHLLYFYDIDQDGQRLVSANYVAVSSKIYTIHDQERGFERINQS